MGDPVGKLFRRLKRKLNVGNRLVGILVLSLQWLMIQHYRHKGCDCKSTWEGPHCQFFKSNAIPLSAATSQASATNNSNATLFAVLGVSCVLAVAALVGFVVWRSHKRRKAEENELQKEMCQYNCDKATDDGSAYSGELKMMSRHII